MKDKFLQLHLLFAYGPSILNRDDQGRHKTAMVGGVERLRYSSQCAKRAWRTSDLFKTTVEGHVGIRTRYLYQGIIDHLVSNAIAVEKDAKKVAFEIAARWAKAQDAADDAPDGEGAASGEADASSAEATAETKGKKKAASKKAKATEPTQVLFLFSDSEWKKVLAVAEELVLKKRKDVALSDFLDGNATTAVDVALWGRMLAQNHRYTVTASCAVSHAITTHKALVEDDYFSACDDCADLGGEVGAGASHIDTKSFGAGVYYQYVCLNRAQLLESLGGDTDLANLAIAGLIKTVTQVTPTAGQSTHAHATRAAYVLAEIGDAQPRSLAAAFTRPVRGGDALADSVTALTNWRTKLDALDGQCWSRDAVRDATRSEPIGSLGALIDLGQITPAESV
ncbi:MAG: type I-E CRISPR-associated protein Cas7/Cse4/CasC [Hyphomicrobiaceae bacterium]